MGRRVKIGALVALPFVAAGTALAGLRVKKFTQDPRQRRTMKQARTAAMAATKIGRFLFRAGRMVERVRIAILSHMPFGHR